MDDQPLEAYDPQGLVRHEPNSDYCINLANRIRGVQKDQDKRWRELDADDSTLPEYLGSKESFASTRRGHRTLINIGDWNLRRLQDKYDDECGPPPPPLSCKVDEKGARNAGTATAIGAALYWVISEGTRLFPPRNLVPVP